MFPELFVKETVWVMRGLNGPISGHDLSPNPAPPPSSPPPIPCNPEPQEWFLEIEETLLALQYNTEAVFYLG